VQKIDPRYQKLLQDLGLYVGRIDGLYGNGSKQAVRKFQTMNGLKADGIIGWRTKAVFDKSLEIVPERDQHNPRIPTLNEYSRWPREAVPELQAFYGRVGQNQTRCQSPYPMKLAWDTSVKIESFSCHIKVADSLQGILETVRDKYTKEEIEEHGFNLFGGCLNVRKIRGGNRWSTHAWGIAIDIDPARNGLRTPWNKAYLSRPECSEFVMAFKNEGWYSLGLERNYDGMHFQACYR